jgi:hypothetical protein
MVEALRKVAAVSEEERPAASAEAEEIAAELEKCSSPEIQKTRRALDAEYASVDGFIRSEWVKSGLVHVQDDRPEIPEDDRLTGITADELLEYAPQALALEIYFALQEDGRLTADQSKNLPSPSTLGAPVDGTSRSTGASVASSGSSETALPSTQAA